VVAIRESAAPPRSRMHCRLTCTARIRS
jgi:hypothetical protein